MFEKIVTLAPGASYTSYQYEPATTRTSCSAGGGSHGDSTATLTLRGASSIGGARTKIDSTTIEANTLLDDNVMVYDSPLNYRYYDIVIKNTGSVTCDFKVAITTD